MADPRDDLYLIAHSILVVGAASALTAAATVATVITFHRERRKQKKIKGNKTMGYIEQILMTPYFRTEFYPSLYSCCLALAYGVLWLPFTCINILGPMVSAHWASGRSNTTSSEGGDEDFMLFDPAANDQLLRRAMLEQDAANANATADAANITISSDYLIPEVGARGSLSCNCIVICHNLLWFIVCDWVHINFNQTVIH